MSNDQQSLIQNTDPSVIPQQDKVPLISFVGLQLFQFIWFIISISESNFFFLLIQIIISACNFIACQRFLGRQLVGLSWKFDLKNPTEYFWSHEIEPDPFVPTKIDSNAFWIGMAGSSLFWLFATLFSFASLSFLFTFVYIIIFALSCINLTIFFKIERISAKISAEAVRTVLLGKSEFPDAEEFSTSDGNDVATEKDNQKPSNTKETTSIDNTTESNNTKTNKDQEKLEEEEREE